MKKLNLKEMKEIFEEVKDSKEYKHAKVNFEALRDILAVGGAELITALICRDLKVNEKLACKLLNIVYYGGDALVIGNFCKKHYDICKEDKRVKDMNRNRVVNFQGLDVIFDRDGNVVNKKELKELLDKIELDNKIIDFKHKANK